MQLAGLDIGSTGCKVTVYDENGAYLGRVYRDYPVSRQKNSHEVSAGDIWQSVQSALAEAARAFPHIRGLGITSFGETFVMLDEQDEPLSPALLYTDPRGSAQCQQLVDALGAQRITQITGVAPHEMYSLPKLMWFAQQMPSLYRRVRCVCLMADFIIYKLTGQRCIDYSLASRTMGFDIHTLTWSQAIMDAAHIDPALLSIPVPTGHAAGTIRRSLADALGLREDLLILACGHDQVAAAIGSGVFSEESTVDGAGTVECMTPVFAACDPQKMAESGYAIVPYIVPGKYVCYAFNYTGGALTDWFIKRLSGHTEACAKAAGISPYAALEQRWQDAPTDILVLPHFAGAATPYMDAGAKGAIVGLTLSHDESDLYVAAMEGICYEMRINQERLAHAGIPIRALRATGGGANSRVFLQMKADILNVPVTALHASDAGSTGCAMMAGIALGVFCDLPHAARQMIRERETLLPRPHVHAAYEAAYQRYKGLYPALRPLL